MRERRPHATSELETSELKRLRASDRLVLREDGGLELDPQTGPLAWSDVEVMELDDPVTETIDLDDEAIISVVEVESATPPHGVPVAPMMSPPRLVRGRPDERVAVLTGHRLDVVSAIAAGDFAGAQAALGHAPRQRVVRPPPPPGKRR